MKRLALLLPLLALAAGCAGPSAMFRPASDDERAAAAAFEQPDESLVARILMTASPGPTKDPVRLEISVVRGLPRPALLTTFRNSESFAFADGSPEAAAFLARAGEEKPWERAAADEAAFPLSFPLTNGWSRNAGFLLGHGWWAETAGVPDFARRQEAWRAFAASLLPDGPDARRRIVGRILLDNDGGGIAESDIGSTPFTVLFTEGGPTNIAVRSHRRHVVEPGGPTVYVPASSSLAGRLAELADETRPWDWKSSNIHAYAGNIVFGGAFASREWHWRGIWTPMAQRREPGFRRYEAFAIRIRQAIHEARFPSAESAEPNPHTESADGAKEPAP